MLIDSLEIAGLPLDFFVQPPPPRVREGTRTEYPGWLSAISAADDGRAVTILSLIASSNGEHALLTSPRLNWLNFEPPSDHHPVVPCSSLDRPLVESVARVRAWRTLSRRIIISTVRREVIDSISQMTNFELHVSQILRLYFYLLFIIIYNVDCSKINEEGSDYLYFVNCFWRNRER